MGCIVCAGCSKYCRMSMAAATRRDAPIVAAYPSLRVDSLVSELAAGLRAPAQVWADHGVVRRDDAALIMAVPMVRQLYDEARLRWLSREEMPVRVKEKAMALVEDALPSMHAGVLNALNPLSQRVAAFVALAKVGGVEQPPEARMGGAGMGGMGGAGGGGGGVAISITMDLGGGAGSMRVAAVTPDVSGSGGSGDGDTFLLNPADYLITDEEPSGA